MLTRRLALVGAGALLGAADRVPVAATPLARQDTPWWRARHQEKLAELHSRRVDLVWLGDSITQDWEKQGPPDWQDFAPVWQRFYGGRNAVNLGFRGDNTSHLLWRMRNGELDGIHPKAAVVLIGANNLGRVHWSAPQTLAGIVAVVDELRSRLPATRVLLLGILPSVRSKYVSRTANAVNLELVERYPPDGAGAGAHCGGDRADAGGDAGGPGQGGGPGGVGRPAFNGFGQRYSGAFAARARANMPPSRRAMALRSPLENSVSPAMPANNATHIPSRHACNRKPGTRSAAAAA